MNNSLVVIRASKGIFWTSVTVEAVKDSAAIYDSLIGDREFFLNKGNRVRLRLKGRDWQRGDNLSMNELVSVALDWSSIPWDWA